MSDWLRRLWCGRAADELLLLLDDDDGGGMSWLARSCGDMVPDAAAAAAATAYWSFSAGGRRLTKFEISVSLFFKEMVESRLAESLV